MKAASFAGLLRVAWSGAPTFFEAWGPAISALAIVTMVFGNLVALAQTNLKRMLAYSAIAHAGYLLIGVLVSRPGSEDVPEGRVSFDEMLDRADVISLHCPLNDTTRGLFGAEEFAA